MVTINDANFVTCNKLFVEPVDLRCTQNAWVFALWNSSSQPVWFVMAAGGSDLTNRSVCKRLLNLYQTCYVPKKQPTRFYLINCLSDTVFQYKLFFFLKCRHATRLRLLLIKWLGNVHICCPVHFSWFLHFNHDDKLIRPINRAYKIFVTVDC